MPLTLNLVTPPQFVLTGTLASGSAAVTALGTTYVSRVGQAVAGTGIPALTVVSAYDPTTPTQVTLSQAATGSGVTSLTFGAEPVTLADAKLHCRVEITDDDALITGLIVAARRVCESRAKRSLITTTYDMILDSFPFGGGYYNRLVRQFYGAFPGASGATWPGFLPTNTGIIELTHPPLQSVDSIKYLDSGGNLQTLDPSVYSVVAGTPGRINPAYGKIWPVTYPQIGAVTIRFACGYGDAPAVPENYKSAIKLLVGDLYEHREASAEKALASNQTVQWLLDADEWGGYA